MIRQPFRNSQGLPEKTPDAENQPCLLKPDACSKPNRRGGIAILIRYNHTDKSFRTIMRAR